MWSGARARAGTARTGRSSGCAMGRRDARRGRRRRGARSGQWAGGRRRWRAPVGHPIRVTTKSRSPRSRRWPGVPMRKGIAITGAVDQHGICRPSARLQNEKVEGFVALGRDRGLTGGQPIVVPAADLRHLMLDPEGRRRLLPRRGVSSIYEAIELLGMPTAPPGPTAPFPRKRSTAAQSRVAAAEHAHSFMRAGLSGRRHRVKRAARPRSGARRPRARRGRPRAAPRASEGRAGPAGRCADGRRRRTAPGRGRAGGCR